MRISDALLTASADAALKSRDSSVKRNVALIKRLRALSEDTRQAVLEDIDKVNQSKVGATAVAFSPALSVAPRPARSVAS